MTWLYLSILVAFIWAVVNVIDKIIVSRLFVNPKLPVVAAGIVEVIVGIILVAFVHVIFSPAHLLVASLGGSLYMVANIFYFYAMRHEEASRVVPLLALGQIWVPIAAAIFLGEIFGTSIYIGIGVIVIGSFLIMWKPGSSRSFSWIATLLMVLSTLGYAGYTLTVGYLVQFYPFWAVAGYGMLGGIFVTIPLIVYEWSNIWRTGLKAWSIMIISNVIDIFALAAFVGAAAVGFIALINSVVASQYVFLFIFSLVLSRWFPRALKEDLKFFYIFLKLFAILLIVAGVAAIALLT